MLTDKDRQWIAKMLWLAMKGLALALGNTRSYEELANEARDAFIEAAKKS